MFPIILCPVLQFSSTVSVSSTIQEQHTKAVIHVITMHGPSLSLSFIITMPPLSIAEQNKDKVGPSITPHVLSKRVEFKPKWARS